MEARILTRPELKVVGMRYDGKNKNHETAHLWHSFINRAAEIRHLVDSEALSESVVIRKRAVSSLTLRVAR